LAITRKDYAEAERMIRLAKSLSASSEQLQPLQISLRTALRSDDGIQQWMRDAKNASAKQDYFSSDGALARYNQILQIAPDYQAARDEREILITQVLKRQQQFIADDELDTAKKELEQIIAVDDTHYQLPEATDALSTALEKRERWLQSALAAANTAMTKKNYAAAGSNYYRILQRSPTNPAAVEGLEKASSGLITVTEQSLANLDLKQTEKNLQALSDWKVSKREIDQMQLRLKEAKASSERRQTANANPAQLGKSMRFAMQRNQWLQPPGESAWDYLRQIRLVEKNKSSTRTDEKLFIDQAWDCYRDASKDNLLSNAGHCLEALRLASPGDQRLAEASNKLALLWRAWASDRIAANELQEARYAVEQAARWDKKHPDQKPLEERLKAISN
jgi:hypothetical protein